MSYAYEMNDELRQAVNRARWVPQEKPNLEHRFEMLKAEVVSLRAEVGKAHQEFMTCKRLLDGLTPLNKARSAIPLQKRVSLHAVIELVAQVFSIDAETLLSFRRDREVIWPRQVAVYLCRKLTGFPTTRIAQAFSDRDHTTIIYSSRVVTKRRAEDPAADELLTALEEKLRAPADGEITKPACA